MRWVEVGSRNEFANAARYRGITLAPSNRYSSPRRILRLLLFLRIVVLWIDRRRRASLRSGRTGNAGPPRLDYSYSWRQSLAGARHWGRWKLMPRPPTARC